MKITFLGAAHEVTGSCTYIEVGDKRGLVDYGMEQGRNLFENEPIPVAPGELDFVLLTHAHIDHAGLLPLLWKQGFRGYVYTGAATVQLCGIMLRDSASIQMQDAEWKSRKAQRSGDEAVEPLYDLEDVDGLMSHMIPCPYDKITQVNDCVSIRLTDVGHLLGSAAIEVWLTEGEEKRKICFSGDIGNTDRIQETLDKGGNMVIPSFAVGRAQEMLYFIREIKERGLVTGHGDFPVYLDSPLAVEATGIFLQSDMQFLDDDMQALIRKGVNPIVFPGLELAVSQTESQAINEDRTPKVIISTSGMCDAGRIRHHLKHNLWRPECRILFVGYQAEGTLGRILINGAKAVKLFNEWINVAAQIDVLPGVSGHADKMGLIAWLKGFEKKPALIFVNHGDPEAADSFTDCLNKELGYQAVAPYSGSRFDLLRGEFEFVAEPRPIEGDGRKAPSTKAARLFAELVAAAERLLQICQTMKGRPNKDLARFTKELEKLSNAMER